MCSRNPLHGMIATTKMNEISVFQLSSPGQAGDLGQVAQRAAAVEGPTGIVPALAAQLVLEIRVRQDGATPIHAQVSLKLSQSRSPRHNKMCCSNVDLTTCRCGHLVYLGVLECVHEDLWERKVGQIPVLFWRINLLGRRRGSKMVQHQRLPRFFPYHDFDR